MITVEEALALVDAHASLSAKEIQIVGVDLEGRVLAEPVLAHADFPSFRQSSMDGYALCGFSKNYCYPIIGEVAAGSLEQFHVGPGEAVRIFTGARVPDACDRVIMQEKVDLSGDQIRIQEEPSLGQNIRQVGSQIKSRQQVLSEKSTLTPASLGLLASLGIQEVSVLALPRIHIVVTGNELVQPGSMKNDVQVYESNSLSLQAALRREGFAVSAISFASDDPSETVDRLSEALSDADLVLISGGISVGDYDFVAQALSRIGVETIFYTVRQKPGKPLFFGKKGNKAVFALPGNPASTLSCFYVYVLRWLRLSQGLTISKNYKRLALPIENRFRRALFVKASVKADEVLPIDEFNSATLLSFSKSDALIYVPADCAMLAAGSIVEIIDL